MTISYPLTFPSITGIAQISISARNVVGMYASPFTGEQQVYRHAGGWWEATITLPPLGNREEIETWMAFLISLSGKYGTFTMGDPAGTSPRGSVSGSPLVNGASQTGFTLSIDGLTVSQTGILKAGDWIQLGSGSDTHLHKVMQDANSNASGETDLDIWPRLRESPGDNAAVTYSSAGGLWRLNENLQTYTLTPPVIANGVTFNAIEAI